ncbi:GNAT family N-acetyltransferase [Gillisia sp. Hel_I_29]|uniref:GNAT family N-acetyltransferase n=1 Tax=Gillisia sp. Hel_I_29 TaxID=1249975 RepID=UPI000689F7CF|nr:GNAT family N-acetyltransferase [Gillisia sp. Hel_I_29]
MKEKIRYTSAKLKDLKSILGMSMKLWKGLEKEDLEARLRKAIATETKRIFIATSSTDELVGFSFFSIRTDYVEGAKDLPTGYLEGIYLEFEYRKLGVAKELVALGEKWCKEKGCSQIGSDTWLPATASRNFHEKLGYSEKVELVHFIKDLE